MKKRFEGLMKAVLVLGFILIIAGAVLRLLHYPFWYSVIGAGLAFKVLGAAIYFLGVKDKQ